MDNANDAANQHYVSQVEQRLNALNPNAEPSNQRIYSFTLADRETFTLTLDSVRGRLISKNLALRDLFSFEVIPESLLRLNFETQFQQYEATLEANTIALLKKLDDGSRDLKKEILEIFVAKVMNFFRNPYSVPKVLNTIGPLLRYEPTDPELLTQYKAVLKGRKPQQAYLCAQLGITQEQYRMWLAALFLMFMRPPPMEVNFLEGTVKQLFENPSGFPMVCVYRYNGEHAENGCLVCDRGFTNPTPEPHLSFNFNLTSRAFVTYMFGSVDHLNDCIGAPPAFLESFRREPKTVRVLHFTNDLDALARYNQNVVYQCHHAAYSSSRIIPGVRVDTAKLPKKL